MATPGNALRPAALACVLVAVIAQSPLSAQTPGGRTLKLEDYLDRVVSDPQITRRTGGVREWVDKKDKWESALDHERRRNEESLPGKGRWRTLVP
jgi:hypothetical protein